MAVIVCHNCHMPFSQKKNEEYCLSCSRSSETTFQRIKDYLYEHQGASATEVVSVLGVTVKQIQHYLREERLEVVGDGYSGLRCDRCGVSIQTGKLCAECAKESEAKKKAQIAEAAKNALLLNHEENLAKSPYRFQTRGGAERRKK